MAGGMTVQIIRNFKPMMFDFQDWPLLAPYSWTVDANGYAVSSGVDESGKRKGIKMHRLILGLTDPSQYTDHINHIRSDNRRVNIRSCKPADNARNRTAKAKYLGVTYQNCQYTSIKTGETLRYKYLKAKIRVDNKLIHLGTFTNEDDAARAYNEAAVKYFGEFANLNVIG